MAVKPPPSRKVPSSRDPRFDPSLNAWPLPPGWMMQRGRRTLPLGLSYGTPPDFNPTGFRHPYDGPGWARSGWGWGEGGRPGMEGDTFIGKAKAPDTGGWVYGLENYYPDTTHYRPGIGGPSRRA